MAFPIVWANSYFIILQGNQGQTLMAVCVSRDDMLISFFMRSTIRFAHYHCFAVFSFVDVVRLLFPCRLSLTTLCACITACKQSRPGDFSKFKPKRSCVCIMDADHLFASIRQKCVIANSTKLLK